MKHKKILFFYCLTIFYAPFMLSMSKRPSKTTYEPVLVQENGELVWKIAIVTGSYNPNPRLTLQIQEPIPQTIKNPKDTILNKFPLKSHLTFQLLLRFLEKPELIQNKKVRAPNTFLFHGEIEKDALYLAQLMHQEFQLPLIHVHGHQFLDNYYAEGSKKVTRALKTRDPKGRPLILFIENFDPIAAIPPYDTDDNAEHEWRMSKSSFRFDFDHLERDPSIILLVSTKQPWNLDEGIISRFSGYFVNITPMTVEERETLLTTACDKLPIEDRINTIKKLARVATGLSRKTLTDAMRESTKLLPPPNEHLYTSDMLTAQQLTTYINDIRNAEGVSWSAYFKNIYRIIKGATN